MCRVEAVCLWEMEGSGREWEGTELREAMEGETDDIEKHSKDDKETQCSKNLPKYMKRIFICSPKNEGYRAPSTHLFS